MLKDELCWDGKWAKNACYFIYSRTLEFTGFQFQSHWRSTAWNSAPSQRFSVFFWCCFNISFSCRFFFCVLTERKMYEKPNASGNLLLKRIYHGLMHVKWKHQKNVAKRNYSRWIWRGNAIVFIQRMGSISTNSTNKLTFEISTVQYFLHTTNWMTVKIIIYGLINSILVKPQLP